MVKAANGKLKLIFVLVGVIIALVGGGFKLTWAAIYDNRGAIIEIKDRISINQQEILQRLTRIETKIEVMNND